MSSRAGIGTPGVTGCFSVLSSASAAAPTMLLERGMAKDALTAFEATLKKEPRRLGAPLGAAHAADKAGDAAKARQHYANALALAADAGPVRPEIAKAREFVAKN